MKNTTDTIESLNSVIRKALKKRKLFSTDDAAKKVVYLAIQDESKKWQLHKICYSCKRRKYPLLKAYYEDFPYATTQLSNYNL